MAGSPGGEKAPTPLRRLVRAVALLVLALAGGLVVALVVRCAIFALAACGRLMWDLLPRLLGTRWGWAAPLAICPVGGLAIGLWTRRFGGAPASLEAVIASVRATGSYRVRSLPASLVGFALPLTFGGSVGPEAGLTGIIASLCSSVGGLLERAGLRSRDVDDLSVAAVLSAVFGAPFAGIVAGDDASRHGEREVSLRRGARIVLYATTAGGAFLGICLFRWLTGAGGGLPRLDGAPFAPRDLPWMLASLAAAWVLALVYAGAHRGFARASERLGRHPVAKPVICGVALGVVGAALPLALFSGEEQIARIAAGWQAIPAIALVAGAVAKAVLTPLCLEFGWRGGHFFPCIFMGVALGYGVAALAGASPVPCAAVACGAFLACVTRRPLLSAALLLLCFPMRSVAWLLLAALVGARLPLPREPRG